MVVVVVVVVVVAAAVVVVLYLKSHHKQATMPSYIWATMKKMLCNKWNGTIVD